MTEPKLLAAIRYGQSAEVEPALDAFVKGLRSRGVRMAGCLQRQLPDRGSCCPISHLEDLSSGANTRITQPLGSGSTGCRLDPGALANAAENLRRQLDSRPDILILNRFGRGESEGRGFRPVIERAVELGIPVLTAVKERYVGEWETFSADLAADLPADPEQLLSWLLPQLTKHQTQTDTEQAAL
ncbi:MAG: DUF2478 domain-containing protein [Roseibium sp.]|uniref:DUF2478 domain-containing protein n=1 Tax=Roseibium sp. TaxID=1936156 RepID=UPI00260F904E|nr:DUF2478 domain-containing protein [Roseibium sp.]MCV0425048.1 DUF2478 domain-containing protein [Roseibium sp.]